jgi:hypothetical protein
MKEIKMQGNKTWGKSNENERKNFGVDGESGFIRMEKEDLNSMKFSGNFQLLV